MLTVVIVAGVFFGVFLAIRALVGMLDSYLEVLSDDEAQDGF